jgi:hypothetical protein
MRSYTLRADLYNELRSLFNKFQIVEFFPNWETAHLQ